MLSHHIVTYCDDIVDYKARVHTYKSSEASDRYVFTPCLFCLQYKWTPVIVAAQGGQLDIVKYLITEKQCFASDLTEVRCYFHRSLTIFIVAIFQVIKKYH